MDTRVGPLTARQLRERALTGEVTHDTLINRAGTDDWVTADRVKGLLPPLVAGNVTLPAGPKAVQSIDTEDSFGVQKSSSPTPLKLTFILLLVAVVGAGLLTLPSKDRRDEGTYMDSITINPTAPPPASPSTTEAERQRQHYRAVMEGLQNNTDSRTVQESLDKIDREHGVAPQRLRR